MKYLQGLAVAMALSVIVIFASYAIRHHDTAVYLRGYDNGFAWGERAVRGEASRLGLGHWAFDDHGEPEFIFNDIHKEIP
jgi:hypothetical protein